MSAAKVIERNEEEKIKLIGYPLRKPQIKCAKKNFS